MRLKGCALAVLFREISVFRFTFSRKIDFYVFNTRKRDIFQIRIGGPDGRGVLTQRHPRAPDLGPVLEGVRLRHELAPGRDSRVCPEPFLDTRVEFSGESFSPKYMPSTLPYESPKMWPNPFM
jgi:hypothetical protein